MKATISIDGRLKVIAESDLESYALERWRRDFDQGTYESILETCIDGTTLPLPARS
jgi:hypothetical protein